MLIKSYKKQLLELAYPNKVDMKKAYRWAGIPYSSYHRNFKMNPEVEISLANAEKIAKQINVLSKQITIEKMKENGM